jgi:UDP-N-acetylmuramoyl-tripeptide--D-alanyl-D-alanine ligase
VTLTVAAVALTAGMVAQATGGRLIAGRADQVFDAVSIDSRTLPSGALFIAIRGEHFDGHAFLQDAMDRGASGLMVVEAPSVAAGLVVVQVRDTVQALQDLGRTIRRASGAKVVAITGSAGKTTTKEITADLLSSRYRVFRNTGNLNNHIGLPLSLVGLCEGPDIAVVEFGMNHTGEIRTLVGIAEPDVRVWTNVGDAHVGHFGSREGVAAAKAEILEQATEDTVVVANADDPLVMAHLSGYQGRRVTFGESAGADVRATAIADRGFDGTAAEVVTVTGAWHVDVPLAGRVQLLNVLAATAVALEFGVPPAEIAARVAALTPVARRGRSSRRADGVRIVDDSYNASPAAVAAMLAALAATPAAGRRIAVLGEMLELGDASRDLHEACGRAAAEAGVHTLVAIGGPVADGFAAGAIAAGLPGSRIFRYTDSASAAEPVARLVGADDLVLVKGSRGTRTDIVADRLVEGA